MRNRENTLRLILSNFPSGIIRWESLIEFFGHQQTLRRFFHNHDLYIPTIHGIYRIEYKTYFADSRRFIEITEV